MKDRDRKVRSGTLPRPEGRIVSRVDGPAPLNARGSDIGIEPVEIVHEGVEPAGEDTNDQA